MECIPKHGYYNSKLGPQRAALKQCLGALAWLRGCRRRTPTRWLGAHRAAVAALKKREAEEAALKQAAITKRPGGREKRKQKRAADGRCAAGAGRARAYKDGSSGSVVECRDCPEGLIMMWR